jgi:hypothetical protein
MRARIVLALLVVTTAAGCGRIADSRINPFNWFGRGERVAMVDAEGLPIVIDARSLMTEVAALTIERAPGGAIIRATGLPPTQGYWDGGLVPVDRDERPDDRGILSYEFRVFAPTAPQRASTRQSREVVVGRFVSNQTLEGVREIRVIASGNARSARR